MPESPRVSFITDFPGSWAFGRIASALTRGFGELGLRFDVVYLKVPRETRVDGLIRTVGLGGVRSRFAVGPITRYLRSATPAVTLAAPGAVACPAVVAGRIAGQVVLPWEQGFARDVFEMDPVYRLLPPLQGLTYRFAPAIAATSDDLREHLHSRLSYVGPDAVHVLPNPLDCDQVRRLAGESHSGDGDRFLLSASGRLQYQKGFDVLLKALRASSGELPHDWSLVILGDNPPGRGGRRAMLERMASEYGLAGRVRFPGHLENPYPIIGSSQVFIHPARWEGFGIVLTEALCLGVPVLATRCPGGPREILGEGEFGRLVPPEDPEALAGALVKLCRSEEDRRMLSERGRQRACSYDPRLIAERVARLANAVANQ